MTKQASITWHDTDGDKPGEDEEVLAQHRNGDHYIMRWWGEMDGWADLERGLFDKSEIIAWAQLPVYKGLEVTA